MKVSDFHFDLPDEQIAQHPPAERGASRMLVLERESGALRDAWFRELPELLRAGDLLVLNDSRVIPARLFARRAADAVRAGSQEPGKIEVLLTERIGEEAQGSANTWQALVKPGRKVHVGERLEFFAGDGERVLTAEVIAAGERGERTLRFAPVDDFLGVLARIGHMPLPPYIRHGEDQPEDRERYQTVYAERPGSAAAPTAGLHFTPQILDALRARGVEIAHVTLHVGLGTFQPVRVEQVEDIQLHAERYTLPEATAEALRRALREGRRIIAVGTTTTRTLEHVAREARADDAGGWIERIAPHSGETRIFLSPGHRFRIVSGLLTNFHLPGSTLLMLVSAFAGQNAKDPDAGRQTVLAAYEHAVREGYRFYSYGDCMLVV